MSHWAEENCVKLYYCGSLFLTFRSDTWKMFIETKHEKKYFSELHIFQKKMKNDIYIVNTEFFMFMY